MKNSIVYILLLGLVTLVFSFTPKKDIGFRNTLTPSEVYEELVSRNESYPGFDVFKRAMVGYNQLKKDGAIKKDIITIIDFRKSSNEKRLWVVDMKNNQILFNTLVAHGKNSGDEYVRKISNIPQSNQSSIGFYVTGNTYYGKHGLSLYLDGVEEGFNDNARKRSIVMHGADYVSLDFAKKYGRIGRSFGCPAIPSELTKEIIHTIKNNSCLFIYYPDKTYEKKSALLKG